MIIKIYNESVSLDDNKESSFIMSEILKLRHRILRKGFPLHEVMFEEDYLDSTRHYVIIKDQELISCLTLMKSNFDGINVWRLRAMAVDVEYQNKGFGSLLINYSLHDLVSEKLMDTIWLHSRTSAESFYSKFNFKSVGDVFQFGNAGDSIKMVREI